MSHYQQETGTPLSIHPEEIGEFVGFVQHIWSVVNENTLISTLLILQALDIVTGVLIAIARKELSSSVSLVGLSKKIAMHIVIGMAVVFERIVNGVPIASLAAMAYIATEGLSILENAAILGLPIPDSVTQALDRVRNRTQPSSQRAMRNVTYDAHDSIEIKANSAIISRRDSSPTLDVTND